MGHPNRVPNGLITEKYKEYINGIGNKYRPHSLSMVIALEQLNRYGKKKELILCSECAKKLGLDNMDIGYEFGGMSDILGGLFNGPLEDTRIPLIHTSNLECKTCGTNYNNFITDGMLECEDCYNTFDKQIDKVLKNIHNSNRHIGRKPSEQSNKVAEESAEYEIENKEETKLEKLQKELRKAVEEERYEDAAKLKNQIKEIEK